MSQGQRPGGLTALAVINFVFGGFGCLGIIALAALLGVADEISGGLATEGVTSQGMVVFSILLSVIVVALLIVSGIGYLGQKKKLGFLCGNIYAITSIVSSLIGAVVGEFSIASLIGFVYPLVTLALLNKVFKDDFINP